MDPERKLTFGDLAIGDHFICFPRPGDNSGHGGYLGAMRLFVKVSETNKLCIESLGHHLKGSGTALDGRGVDSTFPLHMDVIKVMLG